METDVILPDLQSCVLCEDVRCEFNGMQTLVGVINVIPTPALPVNWMRLCIWARWCSGSGKFRQRSRIVSVDEQQVIAQAEVEFVLREMEGHATNVHYFGGVQFQQYGIHHVEIYLGDQLRAVIPEPQKRRGNSQARVTSPKYSCGHLANVRSLTSFGMTRWESAVDTCE